MSSKQSTIDTIDDQPTPRALSALVVSARSEGFRRAGRAWSKVEQTVPARDLTDEQIEALLAEPMLSVVCVEE